MWHCGAPHATPHPSPQVADLKAKIQDDVKTDQFITDLTSELQQRGVPAEVATVEVTVTFRGSFYRVLDPDKASTLVGVAAGAASGALLLGALLQGQNEPPSDAHPPLRGPVLNPTRAPQPHDPTDCTHGAG